MLKAGIFYILVVSFVTFALECNVKFGCIGETQFVAYGTNFTCPKDLVCNNADDEDKITCDPCVKKCSFKCDNGAVDFNGFKVNCDQYYTCNTKPDVNCKPCIRKTCDSTLSQFKCDGNGKVVIGNYTVPCNNGYICNKDFVEPCEPCISLDVNLNQPMAQPVTSTFNSFGNERVKRQGIDIDPADMINCNDGKSFFQPCRPGPTGANYYFKCTLLWNLRYSISIKPCTVIHSDKLCRGFQDMCLPV